MKCRATTLLALLAVAIVFPGIAVAAPYFSVSTDRTFLPGDKITVHLYSRDVPALEFRLYRVNDPVKFLEQLRDVHGFGAGHYGPKEEIEEKTRIERFHVYPCQLPIVLCPDGKLLRNPSESALARFCGFAGADDYYRRSSAGQLLAQIRRPCLILTSQDDPFVPISSFSNPAIRENPYIELVVARHGGHCAFISSEPGDARFWAENRVVEYCLQRRILGP